MTNAKRSSIFNRVTVFRFKSPCGGVYEGSDRKLDAYQRDN